MTSANSSVSLNGELSKPRLRGEQDRINPKSMWIIWPSLSKRMLPLCLKIKQKLFTPCTCFDRHCVD